MQELVEAFDLSHVHHAGAIFDETKFTWFNREYLTRMPDDRFEASARDRIAAKRPWTGPGLSRIMPIIRERISLWGDLDAMIDGGELDYFFTAPTLDAGRIPDKKSTPETAREHLQYIQTVIASMPDSIEADTLKAALWDYATEKGRGAVLWPLRYALSGRDRSPDPFVLSSILGKQEVISRVSVAIALL